MAVCLSQLLIHKAARLFQTQNQHAVSNRAGFTHLVSEWICEAGPDKSRQQPRKSFQMSMCEMSFHLISL